MINLAQTCDEPSHFLLDRYRGKQQVVGHRGRRLAQLVANDLIHAVDLLIEALAKALLLTIVEERPHRGQGRLEAVREIVERITIAIRARPFTVDEEVEVTGDAGQFGGEFTGQRDAVALLDFRDFLFDLAKRAQQSAEQH